MSKVASKMGTVMLWWSQSSRRVAASQVHGPGQSNEVTYDVALGVRPRHVMVDGVVGRESVPFVLLPLFLLFGFFCA